MSPPQAGEVEKARRIAELEIALAAARAELRQLEKQVADLPASIAGAYRAAYRARCLEALRVWGERPSDLRSVEQVILDVELP